MSDVLRIGLFGFGCVGQGLYETLESSKFKRAQITKICIKNINKKRSAPASLFTAWKEDILDSKDFDIIVELIDDTKAAYDIVTHSLKKGIPVVSANKQLIAEHFEELYSLQKETNTPFLYEASCCASIPIIRNLEEYYDNDLVSSLEGVFNGSTNFILSALTSGKNSFDKALKNAQELGFAETDPTLDVEGYDSRYKLSILIAHGFGVLVRPDEIFCSGISKLEPIDFVLAAEKNKKIKLVASCFTDQNEIHAHVIPQFIGPESPLYQTDNEYNGVFVEGAFAEKQFFSGKGAGAWPTAAAVLSDISALSYRYKYEYKKCLPETTLQFSKDHQIWVRISADNSLNLPVGLFAEVITSYQGLEGSYIEGQISTSTLRELLKEPGIRVIKLDPTDVQKYKNSLKSLLIA